MNQNFDAYASYYDLIYRDKDYAAEAEYIATHIKQNAPKAKRILELGCGTGMHAEYLARLGYTVHGVDMSKDMLVHAEERKSTLPPEVAKKLTFERGDARTVRTFENYDVVISLFHVMSYQVTNNDLAAVFETAEKHLSTGGLFMFDFWYGPAVLLCKPEVRIKRLENQEICITRLAEPIMHINENLVDVNYTVFIEVKKTGKVEQIQETHKMRYLFLPELKFLIDKEKWAGIKKLGWMKFDDLCEDDWSGLMLLTYK